MLMFQRDLNEFCSLCYQNSFELNIGKCKHVSYYRNHKLVLSHNKFNNCSIETLK